MIDTTEAAYRLTYQPDGTSITVRENLVDILARELLGPIRGPQEVLPFSPRSQYLVGHLAPVKLTGAALIDDNAVQARANAEALAEGGPSGETARMALDSSTSVKADVIHRSSVRSSSQSAKASDSTSIRISLTSAEVSR